MDFNNVNFTELFNPKGATQPETRSTNEFKPDPRDKKCQTGVYTATIRFVVNPANPMKSIMTKYTAWVVNPVTQRGMYVDDPRSGGASESPVNKLYWQLINTKRANLEQLAKQCLSTKVNHASIVQIVSDAQHPENVGKFMIWRYGKKVYDKLVNEQNPPLDTMPAYNPFDPINGRYFIIQAVMQGGFVNYDQCQFTPYVGKNGETSGVWFVNAAGAREICTDKSDKQVFYNYLVANAPDLSEYDYHDWTAAQQAHVDETLKVIATYASTGSYGQNVAAASPSSINPSIGQPSSIPGFSQPTQTVQPQPAAMPGFTAPAPAPTMGAMQTPQMPNITMPNIGQVNPASAPAMATPQMPQMGGITGIELPDVASPLPNIDPVSAPASPQFGDLSSVLGSL